MLNSQYGVSMFVAGDEDMLWCNEVAQQGVRQLWKPVSLKWSKA